jgi:hypothetical protein
LSKDRATGTAEATIDAGEDFVIHGLAETLNLIRGLYELFVSEVAENILYGIIKAHFARVQDILRIQGFLDRFHDLKA